MTDKKRVWIELDYPDGMTDDDAIENCAFANVMLRRLSEPGAAALRFFWSTKDQKYCIESPGGTFVVCNDNGHWFNLNHFGR